MAFVGGGGGRRRRKSQSKLVPGKFEVGWCQWTECAQCDEQSCLLWTTAQDEVGLFITHFWSYFLYNR